MGRNATSRSTGRLALRQALARRPPGLPRITKVRRGAAQNRSHAASPCPAMIALLADIHANLEALEACLAHARGAGARRFVLLGDLVGYGADPAAVVDAAARLASQGAVVVKGNHDEAVERTPSYLNEMAQAAIRWTRTALDDRQRAFLSRLPLCVTDGPRCYVHASADRPGRWTYVDGASEAARSMDAAAVPHTFSGHVHEQ